MNSRWGKLNKVLNSTASSTVVCVICGEVSKRRSISQRVCGKISCSDKLNRVNRLRWRGWGDEEIKKETGLDTLPESVKKTGT